MKKLRILALEPYYGGSHQAFLDTWVRHSRHDWTLETLKARHWKWRMRGSAMWFAEQLQNAPAGRFDALVTCDMTSIADLRALLPLPLREIPMVCYFHENQLTYPLAPDDRPDYQFGLTNITSALAADGVWFNSHAHRSAFLEAANGLLKQMPDFVPRGAISAMEAAAVVQYPAIEPPRASFLTRSARPAGPPRILWSHRWEYDKNPASFFNTMLRLHDAGADFELVLVGEQFRTIPEAFAGGFEKLRARIAHAGFLESVEAYWRMISTCDIVVSTAIQENFGLAVVEAILAGCYPLLPRRLSYPELIPPEAHARHLYEDDQDLFERLKSLCADERSSLPPSPTSAAGTPTCSGLLRSNLVESMRARFTAPAQVSRLDNALEACVALKKV